MNLAVALLPQGDGEIRDYKEVVCVTLLAFSRLHRASYLFHHYGANFTRVQMLRKNFKNIYDSIDISADICQTKALKQIEKLHYADMLDEFEPIKIYKYAVGWLFYWYSEEIGTRAPSGGSEQIRSIALEGRRATIFARCEAAKRRENLSVSTRKSP